MPPRDDPLPLEAYPPRALYVHLPFCARRCPYCDFATAPLNAAQEARYLDALGRELAARAPASFRPDTVYLGGGTPAELTTPGLERLVELLAPHAAHAREVTVEANPRTLLPRKLARLVELGVDRVSLGVQSFAAETLEALGRFHRADDVRRAVDAVRAAGVRSLSLDLIFAVPGQSLDDLARDLDALLAQAPEHVSVYCLTVEPETEFHRQRERGELVEQSDARQAAHYALARRTLRAAGYEHYEVSSFAKPGHRSRHNRAYWRNLPYLGVGNGAASTWAASASTTPGTSTTTSRGCWPRATRSSTASASRARRSSRRRSTSRCAPAPGSCAGATRAPRGSTPTRTSPRSSPGWRSWG
ncbi:MAG: radical SAM family heme chaperone HemW [Planctomycetota bacterium]